VWQTDGRTDRRTDGHLYSGYTSGACIACCATALVQSSRRPKPPPGARNVPARNGSSDVIGHVTIRSDICHFLLLVHWNRASISPTVFEIFGPKTCKRTHEHTNERTNIHTHQQTWPIAIPPHGCNELLKALYTQPTPTRLSCRVESRRRCVRNLQLLTTTADLLQAFCDESEGADECAGNSRC